MISYRHLHDSSKLAVWIAVGLLFAGSSVVCGAEVEIEFNRDIRPILSDKCIQCHGPDAEHREAELRLDVPQSAEDEIIVAGKPDDSELIARIISEDPDEQMPPPDSGKQLSEGEIQTIRQWIQQGAEFQQHWAYVAPSQHVVPGPKSHPRWPINWIDQFILARLEREGIRPSKDADRVTLIRRLSFDLTGLPPTPDEVDAFVADKSPQAYEKLVDRLLDSPRYGERLAMYWLDLVRFANTVGYHGDQDHAISPYRDWVIDALNDNMPLDQFTREQLAGDLLPNATIDQKIATGYNRLLQTSHEGGVQPKEYLAIYAADRVRNLSAVWMGATLGCAQCHDHKYDPYTGKDFYSVAAFFADVDEAQHFKRATNSLPTARPPELSVLSRGDRKQIAEIDKQIKALEAASPDDSDTQTKIKALQQQRATLAKNTRRTMVTVSIKPRTMRILPRGNWLDDSGPIVEPAFPAFMAKLDTGDQRPTRLDLANWLTDSEHGTGGLTARVFANRFWYLMFGSGIARVLDDFGGQGEPPVHPELLDNLAVEFYESGWNVKHMFKLIAMSHTYRQSSLVSAELQKRDPYNRLYARQSRFRIDAEMVRDSALAISGLLVLDPTAESVKPYQPAGYYRHLNFPKRTYQMHNDTRQWRRGVYVHWQRQFLHPMLKAFDAPSREECTAQRPRSNTPLASLTLLNDPTFVEAARVFAARILIEGGDTSDTRLDYAFRQAVSRKPDSFERALLLRLLTEDTAQYKQDVESAKKLLATGIAPAAEEIDIIQHAAWTSLARAILNMSETIARN